jgi:CRP-like cAMP-binding protein
VTLEQAHGHDDRTAACGIALTSVWPEIDHLIPAEDRDIAARLLMAPPLSSGDDELTEHIAAAAPTAFDFLVAEGLVLKETVFAGRSALELLGPGDVLAPPLTSSQQLESRAVSRYSAHGRASIAVLDHRFTQAARRWPGLFDVLHDRLGRQTHRASMHLAMLHQPRAEDRIMSLFVDLAERFGRMTAHGAVIGLDLKHELIGRLVGAQRPTVTLALSALASAGALARLDDGGWRVALDAPAP